jgi:hypothetical protein
MLQSRWGRRLAALYLLVVAFAGGFLSYHAIVAPHSSQPLAALVIGAGMPWSFLLSRALDPDGTGAVLLVMGSCLVLNTLLLYWVGVGLDHLKSRKPREAL